MRRRDAAEAAWARAKATSCALTCYSTTSPVGMLVALGRCYNLQVGASGLLVSQAHGSRWHGMLARCIQGQVGTWRARQAVVKWSYELTSLLRSRDPVSAKLNSKSWLPHGHRLGRALTGGEHSSEQIVLLVALERGEVGEEERAAMEIAC